MNNWSKRVLAALSLAIVVSVGSVRAFQRQEAESTSPDGEVAVEGADGEVRAGNYSLKLAGVDTSAWPAVRLDFSVVNRANEPIDSLRATDVAAAHDGSPVATELVLKRGGPANVFLVLDGSLSMKNRGPSISKLGAARGALITFIEQMGPKDRAGFAVFADELTVLVPVTSDKTALIDAVATFMPEAATAQNTRLYRAVELAVEEARKGGVRNVVLMSDGWEDTAESRELMKNPPRWTEYKAQREQAVADVSRRAGVRVFTIALGDRNGTGLAFVDYEALDRISKGTDGGTCSYVDLPELERKAQGDVDAYRRLFLQSLASVFSSIGQSVRYDYSLTLLLGDAAVRDDREHLINLDFTVGAERLPAVVTYTWKGAGADDVPAVTSRRALPGMLISTPAASATRPRLAAIFLVLLVVLSVMAGVPAVGRRLLVRSGEAEARKVIVSVAPRSPLVGSECPNERAGLGGGFLIKPGDVVVVCGACGSPHHIGCWHMNRDTCWNRACEHETKIPDELARTYELEEATS